MRSLANCILKNLCLGAGILNFSTFFSVMAALCPSGPHNRQAAMCSGIKQTVVCITRPSYYVCSSKCTLPLCTAVYSGTKQKPESESLHPFSIDRSHHLPEKDSQKQAVHFVAQQWSSRPKGHQYQSVPSDEMLFLEQAYIDQFFTPCGDDGRLANTAPFTLTQVYVAYYMALACIESLADLKQYEQTKIDEKIEKKKADDMLAAIQATMLSQGVPIPTAVPAA